MNKRIYFLVRRAFYSLQDENDDVDAAWSKVKSRCEKSSRQSLRLRFIKCAAIFILALSGGSYLWYFQFPGTPGGEQVDFQPVQSKVKLILATGEHISLENPKQNILIKELGVEIMRDSSNNALCYHVDSLVKERDTSEYNQLIVPKGGEFCLKLADGSSVWLNSESTLKFPVQFASTCREVYLEGEAFFDIRKDEHTPFIVRSGDRSVTVLGTRFNISAYGNDPNWQVTLVQGCVSVQIPDHENKILHPSEQYVFNNLTGNIEMKTVETELYTSWIDGKFYFKGYRFEDIVKKLERWYDFQIRYQQEEIKDMYFRGVIDKHQPLEKILRYLEETTDIAFDVQGKIVTVKKIPK